MYVHSSVSQRPDVAVCSVTQSCPTLCNPWNRGSGGLSPWDFSGESTGVGCHLLLQELSSYYQTILEKNGNPLQYCLGNPMDRGAWWATVLGVTEEFDTT